MSFPTPPPSPLCVGVATYMYDPLDLPIKYFGLNMLQLYSISVCITYTKLWFEQKTRFSPHINQLIQLLRYYISIYINIYIFRHAYRSKLDIITYNHRKAHLKSLISNIYNVIMLIIKVSLQVTFA